MPPAERPVVETIPSSASAASVTGITIEPDTAEPEAVDEPAAGTGAQLLPEIPERVLPGGLLEIGDPNAPVSLLLFTNYACAYCKTFHDQIEPRLLSDYVRPGSLRLTIAPFPLRKYAESDAAAAMLLCAAEQGKGKILHNLLFARGGANLNALGTDAETSSVVDWSRIRPCMAEPATLAVIAQQRSWARALGITLIPTAIIDGQKMVGLPEYADIRAEVDRALAAR